MDQAAHNVMPDHDQAAVEAFFGCVKAVADAESLQTMLPALQRRLQQPPTALLSAVLEQELTDEQARQLLFFPEPADMALYPKLLAGDPACPTDLSSNAANKAQAAVLGHLFLVHGRSWQRLRPFIEAGGLRSLVSLLGHPNRLLASQALQLLLLATHPDMYDWHSPPGSSSSNSQSQQQQEPEAVAAGTSSNSLGTAGSNEGTASTSKQAAADAAGEEAQLHNPAASSSAAAASHPSQGPDRQLWLQLLALHEGPLLPRLLALSPDAWPGSGQQALQLLAFYLSWLRACLSQGGVLQLSPGLLSGLAAWAARSTVSSEERQLAAALVKDFGAAGPAAAAAAAAGSAVDSSSAWTGGSSDAGCIGVVGFEPAVEYVVVADRTQINSSPGSEAAALKAAGNAAFKARDWATAIRLYSAALDVPVPSQALLGEAPRRAVYHTNRAAAYLERVWELQAAAAAARDCAARTNGNDVDNTRKLIVELDPEATAPANASSSSSSSQPSSWLEVGGSLDGMQLDSSPDSLAKQLEAAVLDCRAALQLVPQHAKAHYRLATALCAQGKLPQALAAAAAAAEQHAACAADAAAAARLAAAIKEQQQQGDAQPRASAAVAAGKPAGSQSTLEPSRVASASDHSSSSSNTAGCNMPPSSKASSGTAVEPLGPLLQQFAAAVGTNAAAGAAVRPAKACGNRDPAAAGILEIKTPAAAAAAAAAGGSSLIGAGEEGLTSIKMPQKQQGKKGAAAGRVLVQVLASSDGEQACSTAAAAAADEAVGAAAAGEVQGQPRNAGFIMQEVASTKTTKGTAGMSGSS